jgi:hypothetical protein
LLLLRLLLLLLMLLLLLLLYKLCTNRIQTVVQTVENP